MNRDQETISLTLLPQFCTSKSILILNSDLEYLKTVNTTMVRLDIVNGVSQK